MQEADRLLKRAKELPADSPEPVLIYEAVARGLMRTYRMLDAERCLSLWLEREPQNSQALLWRGWVRKNGFENEAIPIDYVEAVKADEENDDARLRLAEELMTRKPDEALVHFQKLRQRLPENLEAAVGEALCYKDLARKDDAQARLDALLTPERLRLIGEVSDAILKGRPLDHPVTRMPWYENTIALAPFESRYQPRYVIDLLCRSLIERADLEMQDGKDADAERDLREAVKLDPFDYKGTYKLSVCLNRQRRKDEATATMDRASQLAKGAERLKVVSRQILQNPLDPAARAEAGKLCMDSGHPEQAVRWLESALQIDPNNQDARRTLDEFYQRAGSKGAGR